MQTRQAAQREYEMPVGTRIILGPHRIAARPGRPAARAEPIVEPIAAPVAAGGLRIHQAGKGPLGFLLVVGRQGNVAHSVLHARKFAKWELESIERAHKHYSGRGPASRT